MEQSNKLTPFRTIEEAKAAFPSPTEFRLALVDDVHFEGGLFDQLRSEDLLRACGIEPGEYNEFCLSQAPSDRAAFNRGDDFGWTFIYTYRIQGRNRRTIRFQTEHGGGGVCESCNGPYIYRRRGPASR